MSKLLKTNPAERINLDEVTNHPWFKANPAIKPVLTQEVPPPQAQAAAQKLPLDTETIKKENYQVVSKPSIANKAEA